MKLNTIKSEFAGKAVLLVDDSIVRGTTSSELVAMARDAGAAKVFFISASPEVRYPNVYGINISSQHELIAHNRSAEDIAAVLGADWVLFQDLPDLEDAVRRLNPRLENFEASVFSGKYVTDDVVLHDDGSLNCLNSSTNSSLGFTASSANNNNNNNDDDDDDKKSRLLSSSPAQGTSSDPLRPSSNGVGSHPDLLRVVAET